MTHVFILTATLVHVILTTDNRMSKNKSNSKFNYLPTNSSFSSINVAKPKSDNFTLSKSSNKIFSG